MNTYMFLCVLPEHISLNTYHSKTCREKTEDVPCSFFYNFTIWKTINQNKLKLQNSYAIHTFPNMYIQQSRIHKHYQSLIHRKNQWCFLLPNLQV